MGAIAYARPNRSYIGNTCGNNNSLPHICALGLGCFVMCILSLMVDWLNTLFKDAPLALWPSYNFPRVCEVNQEHVGKID